MRKTRCPYCGKELNYFQAFMQRKHGEYKCRRCGRNSTVYFSNVFKFAIAVAVLISAVLVVIFIQPKFIQNLWGMLWVAVPFLLLYLATPFFVRLVPIIKKKKHIAYDRFSEPSADAENSKTKVVPRISSSDEVTGDVGFMDISHLE